MQPDVHYSVLYLKCDLSQTSGAFNVESEDGKPKVKLILNGLLTSVELLAFVNVLATRFTPANHQELSTISNNKPYLIFPLTSKYFSNPSLKLGLYQIVFYVIYG